MPALEVFSSGAKNFCRVLDIRVSEGVRVDVGQIVAAGKVVEPAGNAVRVHTASIIRCEHKAGALPAVTIGQLQPELIPLVLPKQAHGFGGQGQINCRWEN